MKKFSKILALVLCLAMMFALCACGSSDTEKFIGKWEAKVDMTDTAIESLETELGDLMEYFDFGKFVMVMTLSFNEDGTYEMELTLDEDTIDNFYSALEEGLWAFADANIEAEMEEFGVDKAGLEEAYLEAFGMSIDEYYGAVIEDTMAEINIENLLTDVTQEGNWKAEDGKLFMSDDIDSTWEDDCYDLYEGLTESGFSIVKEIVDGEEDTSIDYPLVFSKVG